MIDESPSEQAIIRKLERRLDRERRTREEAERLAEQGMLELYQKQTELTFLQAIAIAATYDVDTAFQAALDQVCMHTGWPVGHVYFVSGGKAKPLEPSKIWHLDDPDLFAPFREATEKATFSRGEGLPGRVLQNRKPAWVEDVTLDENFTRTKHALDLGVRAGLAFPVMANGEVAAVMEFYSGQVVPPDHNLLALFASVGHYVGRAIEREQADRALRESEQQFRTLYENSPIGIYRTTPDGDVMMANPALLEMLGYEHLEELRERNLNREGFADGDSREQFTRQMLQEGQVTGFEAHWTRRDGSSIIVRENARIIRDNQERLVCYEGTVEDITQKQEAAEALRESEHRFRSVVESASEAIVLVNAGGNIVSWNGGATRMFGYEANEVIGEPIETIIPERFRSWRETGLVRMKRQKKGGMLRQTIEISGLRKTGELFPMELSLTTWRSGRDRLVAGIIRDISERKDTERLRLERDAAKAASEAKSTFLATMSHELRTPLNSVIAMSDILTEQYFGELNEKQLEYVKDVRDSGEHLLSLINDILDLSKVEAGYSPLELAAVSLPDLIKDSLKIVRERAQTHSIQVDFTADEVPDVQCDERKIRQVAYNLLSNAVKFTPDGGKVSVTVKSTEPDKVLVEVRDTGIGIPRGDHEKVFDAFVQADGSLARKYEGTGLGLALSKRLIEQHNGRIWLTSSVGAGSTFSFELPFTPVEKVSEEGVARV